MKTRSSLAILGAVLTTACMPMEQAPLVYASKHQFGVAVAAGTADSPGLDVSIGYKDLDAAFVPVAVAKHCDVGRGNCAGINYDIQPVAGSNSTNSETSNDAKRLAAVEQLLAKANSDLAANSGALQTAAKQQQDLAGLGLLKQERGQIELKKADANGDGVPDNVLSQDENSRLSTLIAQIDKTEALNLDAKSIGMRVAALTKDNNSIAKRKESLETQRDTLKEARRAMNGDAKQDAYSVYGSFGGGANGDKNGAGLTLGKVFSTGVAAQNVSQGIRNAARTAAVGECLVKAKALLGGSTDADVLKAAVASCTIPPNPTIED